MRVLQVNKYNYLRGGSEAVFFNTIKMLEEHGHEVARMCVNHPKNEPSQWQPYFVDAPEIRDIKGVAGKLRSIPRFFMNRDAARKMEQLVCDFRPDVVHLHNIFNGISLSILPVLKRHGVPVVITLHDTRFICPTDKFNMLDAKRCNDCLKSSWGLNCGLYRCYEGSFVNSWMCALEMLHKERMFHYDDYIDRYIFVSGRYKDFHSARHEFFTKKGSVLYNFDARVGKFNPEPNRGSYFLFFGRIAANKGITTLVETMQQLPDVKLHVVGTGPLFDELKSRSMPNVDFLGYKSGKELSDEIENASFIVVPSEWEENNPMTIVEGYTYGKPVIGSSLGGIPEIIEQDRTGYVFPAFDKEALAATIRKASQITDERYAEMSRRARAFAEEHFNPDTYYTSLMAVYESAGAK